MDVLSHRNDLRVEFCRESQSVRLPAEQPVERLHGARRYQLLQK